MGMLPNLWGVLHKEADLVTEIRRGWVLDTEWIMLIDKEPSTESYGDWIIFNRVHLDQLIGLLSSLSAFVNAGEGSPGPNQERLF
jgi:hypothetical protein